MDKLISIIIPVYGVEKYLEKCIDSILYQTYKNLEIILVDDGSKDMCPKICDEYEKKDSRIKVIHKVNGGLSSARNEGLKIAKGEYIGFIDSDDFVEKNMFELLLKTAVEKNSDIVICGYNMVDENGKELGNCLINSNKEIFAISRFDSQNNYFEKKGERGIYTVAWNKLYKKQIVSDLVFPEGKIHEDEATSYKLLYKGENIQYINKPLYNYLIRSDSIMAMKIKKERFAIFDAYLDRIVFYKKNNEEILYNKMIRQYMRMLCQYKFWSKEYNKELIKLYHKKLKTLIKENHFDLKGSIKLEYYLYSNMIIYYFIWKMKGR